MYLRTGLQFAISSSPAPSFPAAVQLSIYSSLAVKSLLSQSKYSMIQQRHCQFSSFLRSVSRIEQGQICKRNSESLLRQVFQRIYLGGRSKRSSHLFPASTIINRQLSTSSSSGGSGDGGSGESGGKCMVTIKDGLTTPESAMDFLDQLSLPQKELIYHTLNIEHLRDKYEGHLGSSKQESHMYLSKFGRPATAKEDPTGTLCEVSPKWLHARLDEKALPAPPSAVWAVAVKNALPFIGFGFLDNLIMILAGDYIDITIGTALGISTMAAAALGNTISDVAGIGSAWYVEEIASKIGIKDPDLTPSQMASGPIRWACNLGRALGVTIGCLLGMFPLLFLPNAEEVKEKKTKECNSPDEDNLDKSKNKFA